MADSLKPQTTEKPGAEAPFADAIQGVSGGVPVAVSGSFSATTSAHATAAAPTYAEGTDNPLSVDLSGGLRTSGGGAGGGLTDAELRASPVPVSVSGVSTAAKQDTGNASLASIDGKDFATQATLALIKAKTDNIPASPSTDRAAAGGPFSVELSDGAAFYTAAKTGQLPAALDGSGFLKTHEQGTAAIAGNVASGVADSGNPVKTGGVFTTAQPTVATGQRVDSQSTARGGHIVAVGVDGFAITGTVTTTPPSNASTNVAQFGGTNVSTGTGAGGAGIPRVTVSNDSNIIVTPPTLTKGTQGSTGFSTQDLKDAGRVWKSYAAVVTPTTTDTILTMTPTADGTAGSTASSFAVTSGKRLRLQTFSVLTLNAGAASQGVVANLRATASGAAIATSPLVVSCAAGTYVAVANNAGCGVVTFPDGFELSGTMQFGVSILGTNTAGARITVVGYEY